MKTDPKPIQGHATPDYTIIDDPYDAAGEVDTSWYDAWFKTVGPPETYYHFGHGTINETGDLGWNMFVVDEHAQSIVDEYTSQYRQKGICRQLADTNPTPKD